MITVEARLELFKKAFPKEKIKYVLEREGQDHSVLEINHTFMCKTAKKEEGIAVLAQEEKILKALQGKTKAAIPQPLHYEENFLVYKKIPGSPLFSYMINNMGNKQRSKLIMEIGEFLFQLHHALSEQEAQALGLQPVDWPWSFEKLQEHRSILEAKPEFLELFDHIMAIYKDLLQDKKSVLLHNDFHIKNIIVDPITGQLRGIIDFTDVAFDDFAFDLRMRRYTPVDFIHTTAVAYAVHSGVVCSPEKMYGYYFATEFSRYFEMCQNQKENEAQEILYDIVRSVQNLSGVHDECKKRGVCVHQKIQSQPAPLFHVAEGNQASL